MCQLNSGKNGYFYTEIKYRQGRSHKSIRCNVFYLPCFSLSSFFNHELKPKLSMTQRPTEWIFKFKLYLGMTGKNTQIHYITCCIFHNFHSFSNEQGCSRSQCKLNAHSTITNLRYSLTEKKTVMLFLVTI